MTNRPHILESERPDGAYHPDDDPPKGRPRISTTTILPPKRDRVSDMLLAAMCAAQDEGRHELADAIWSVHQQTLPPVVATERRAL